MASPSFEIPARPRRRYPHGGGVEYEGGTVFSLTPRGEELDLPVLVESLLSSGPYQFGDFLDLPMPLWLVRDEETADVFRIAVPPLREHPEDLHHTPRTTLFLALSEGFPCKR